MFKKLLKNKIGQNTAEYALLIALVVAAVIAMQTYAQRAIQARIRDAAQYMTTKTPEIGSTNQYEPYYAESKYDIDRDTKDVVGENANAMGYTMDETRKRQKGGVSNTTIDSIFNGV